MSCECEDTTKETTNTTNDTLSTNPNVVFEASTQTPTAETCESPLFSPKGYCLKTNGHSYTALNNIHKMKQHGQVRKEIRFLNLKVDP